MDLKMLAALSTKKHSTPVERLAARLLRQSQFSVSQISALIRFAPSMVIGITKDISAEDLKKVTLDEVGAPGDSALYRELLRAAQKFCAQRQDRLQMDT